MSSDNPKNQTPPPHPESVNPLVRWRGREGMSYSGIDSILFWLKPSLVSMLRPLKDEIGEDLYFRLIAFEASKGTLEDFQWMMNSGNFETGFQIWADAVCDAGWGYISIVSMDFANKEAVVSLQNPWELRLFETRDLQNNIPFLAGKMS